MIEKSHFSNRISNKSLKYIAGYVAFRFKEKLKNLNLGSKSHIFKNTFEVPDWIHIISRGNLVDPSKEMFEIAKSTNTIFENYHGNLLSKEDKVTELVVKHNSLENKFLREYIHCLVRTRTYIRLKEINKKK